MHGNPPGPTAAHPLSSAPSTPPERGNKEEKRENRERKRGWKIKRDKKVGEERKRERKIERKRASYGEGGTVVFKYPILNHHLDQNKPKMIYSKYIPRRNKSTTHYHCPQTDKERERGSDRDRPVIESEGKDG